jgi:tRNA-binding protein
MELSGRAIVGTVVEAAPLEGARRAAYRLRIDFGPAFGQRASSAQVTDLYRPDDLVGRQVVALVDLGSKRIAGFESQVLVLGLPSSDGVVLLAPERPVADGLEVF